MCVGICGGAGEEGFDVVFGEADEDDAVFAGVGEEDVGEAGGDDGEEAEVVEGPGGVLAGAAAAEVLSGDEDLRALVMGLVEDEVRVGLAGVGAFLDAAPVVEEEVAVAGALDALEELLGDDLVGVDVGQRQRGGVGGEDVDGVPLACASFALLPVADVGEVAGDGGGGGHLRGDEVGAASAALAAFEVAVAGGGAAFAGGEDVGVHAEAHAAAGFAPLEACVLKISSRPSSSAWRFDGLRAGDDHGADGGGDVVALDDRGGGAEVFDAGVGAGAEEDGVDLDLLRSVCRALRPMYSRARAKDFLVGFGGVGRGRGTVAFDAGDHAGRGAPGDGGGDVGGVDVEFAVEDCSCVGGKCRASGRRPRPMLRRCGEKRRPLR